MDEGEILQTRADLEYWRPNGHATSVLPAEGDPPPRPDTDDEVLLWEWQNEVASWTCMYGPLRAADGDPATAWCEGVEGNGEGEFLLVHIGDSRAAEIWRGFGRSGRLHKRNGRPRGVRVHVLQALSGLAHQYDLEMGHFLKLAEAEAELKDLNGYQPLPLPEFSPVTSRDEVIELLSSLYDEVPDYLPPPDSYIPAVFVAVEILSAYPGSAYEDTLISEVRAIE